MNARELSPACSRWQAVRTHPVNVPLTNALLWRECAHCGLNLPNGGAECSRCEKSGTERARGVLTKRWQLLKRRPDLNGHVFELPEDLDRDGRGLVRAGQPGRFRGISCCAQSMRAHMSDTGRLASGPGRRDRRRGSHRVRGATGTEAPPNFTSGIKLTPSERSSTNDGITRSSVRGCLCLE